MTHTPGPWRVIEKVGFSVYPEDSPVYIAFMNNARSNCEANANLMAIAPEMLDLLEWQTYLHHGVSKGGGKPSDAEWEECLEQSKLIIAKAKGE